MRARLHPHWGGGEAGYVYSVIYDGKLLVERSRDPECDAARALLAKGITPSPYSKHQTVATIPECFRSANGDVLPSELLAVGKARCLDLDNELA